ncbi:hypothetical protein [Helicobacter cetorum]|uniref:hypothetical protein n=1 Tax=Helicobacter cetorum TaxID=138563 RepID=UPI000CF1060D|nr:hypothetical protein [Helicobacter cetorum]
MEKSYKKYIVFIFLFMLSAVVGVGIFNYIIDPFEYFRKAKYPIDYTSQDDYLLFNGLIKHYDFENVIAGSSVSMNFSLKDTEKTLNMPKVIKLGMVSSVPIETIPTLSFALQHKPIKNILMDLTLLLNGEKYRLPYFMLQKYYPPINSLLYLFNISVFKKSLYYTFRFIPSIAKILKPTPFDLMFNIYNNSEIETYDSSHLYHSYKTLTDKVEKFLKDKTLKDPHFTNSKEFDEKWTFQLVSFVKEHPNIHFIFWINPSNILYYKAFPQSSIKDILEFDMFVTRKIVAYPNVEIHDLRTMPLASSIHQYMDTGHFDLKGAHEVLEAIKSKKYLLNKNNIDLFNQKLIKMIEDYQIPKEFETFKKDK